MTCQEVPTNKQAGERLLQTEPLPQNIMECVSSYGGLVGELIGLCSFYF